MIINKDVPEGLNLRNFDLKFIKGSIKIEELFKSNTIISFFQVVNKSQDVRYDSTGESAYDSYYDIGSRGKNQLVKMIRAKGLVSTSYGAMRPFDVMISYNAGITKSLKDELILMNSKITQLASFLENNTLKKN